MKLSERKTALPSITENIEMELFSSEESCMGTPTPEEEEEQSVDQEYLDHPLAPACEEEPDPEVQVQRSSPRQQVKPKPDPPIETEIKHRPPLLVFMEEIEIEMEVLTPHKVSETELVDIKSCDPSIMTPQLCPNKANNLKWKRLMPQKTGLVVIDVVCLPRGYYLEQLGRRTAPRGKARAALAAAGMTARITIDYGWSASQMESRLAMLFHGRFVKRAGQKFTFTYLQCVLGSGVLFVPDTPAEGWTGEQVLRISGHGALYILSHQDCPQAESEKSASKTPVVNRKEFCLEASTESSLDKDSQLEKQNQPCVPSTIAEFPLNLDSTLRLFRQENMGRGVETHIQVRRRDLLHCALKVDGSISSLHLPHASTCALELFLPRGVAGPADLLALQSRAVHEALSFTHFPTEAEGEGGRRDLVTG